MSTILVMDDEEQVRLLIREYLERADHQVLEAADGREGLRIFREQTADLVIVDLIMPGKEGLETIAELRRDDPEVKIIAISGGGRVDANDYLLLAKNMGALITLNKPFTRQELLDSVQKLL
ncbi:MAG: response regulator [Planctomycetota bacterium]